MHSVLFSHVVHELTDERFENHGTLRTTDRVSRLQVFHIRPGFKTDTSAKILTAGLLGEQYIGLEAGADMENLQTGDTIRRTQSAVVLETLISQFMYNMAEKN